MAAFHCTERGQDLYCRGRRSNCVLIKKCSHETSEKRHQLTGAPLISGAFKTAFWGCGNKSPCVEYTICNYDSMNHQCTKPMFPMFPTAALPLPSPFSVQSMKWYHSGARVDNYHMDDEDSNVWPILLYKAFVSSEFLTHSKCHIFFTQALFQI